MEITSLSFVAVVVVVVVVFVVVTVMFDTNRLSGTLFPVLPVLLLLLLLPRCTMDYATLASLRGTVLIIVDWHTIDLSTQIVVKFKVLPLERRMRYVVDSRVACSVVKCKSRQ